MKSKKFLCALLAICLIVGLLPAVSLPVEAEVIDNLEEVTEPVIGNSYYLAANVNGVLKYFTTGTVSATAPYSLVTTERISGAVPVILEEPSAALESKGDGFQLTYESANGSTARIYCMDVLKDATTAGQTGIMDTGVNTSTPYRGRHSFDMVEIDGQKVLQKLANNNVLVVKYFESTKTYRMLGVPVAELENEGVYLAKLYENHEHTYAGWTFDTEKGTQTKFCTGCGEAGETLYGTDVKGSLVTEPVIGNSYHLAANAGGKLIFFRHGLATDTSPYSLVATDDFSHNWVLPLTIEDPSTAIDGTDVGFQLIYNRPDNGALSRIYCYDVLKDATVAGQTGVMDTGINSVSYKNRHTFFIDEVDGVKVIRKIQNDNILVAKYNDTKKEWRILGVPEADLSNEGVYPVMLMNVHTHTYGTTYEKDAAGHWFTCECGAASNREGHSFVDGVCVCGKREAAPLEEGIYYLKATRSGVTYYFRHALSNEKVTYTTPYSLYTDTDKAAATLVDVIKETDGNFSLAYPYNSGTARIYVYDVGTNGSVDTGVNTQHVAQNHHFLWDGENTQLYQMEGAVKYVLAIKEKDNSNTGKKQIRMLAVPESELDDSVVPVELEIHTQHICDSWVVETPATTSSTGLKTGTCTVCDRQFQEVIPMLTPAFSGKDISLENAFSLHFYVDKAAFADGVYQNPYVIFDVEDVKTTVSAYTQSDDCYIFTYEDIIPDEMGKTVTATLYADKQDGTQFSVSTDYSVAEYCYEMLEQKQTSDAMRTLLVEVLNFGAAAQKYRNNNISAENLVNANLTEEERAWGYTGELRALQTCKNFGENDGEVKWYGASLLMGDSIKLRVYFDTEDITDLYIQANGETLTNICKKDGKYYIDYTQIKPAQMGEEITITAYKAEKPVSSTMYYSLESYAESWLRRNDATDAQKELVTAMIRYGDAVKAYVERVYDLQQDVLYLGRTYEMGGAQWFNWSASGFSVRFQGSGLKAKIASNAPDAKNYAYLKVYIDGVEQSDILLDKTLQTVVLAEDLNTDEIHTVEVRKRNSPRSSTAGLLSMEVLNGKKAAPADAKDKLIEFVGDSLTVGYSAADVNKTETAWSTKTEDGTKTYSKQVADALGAEYMVTAISGRGVVMNNANENTYKFPDIYPELDIYNVPGTAYDFKLQPDVIVINLGTNDATNAGLKNDVFQAGVVSFIKTVREKNPNAQIIWAYGLRNDKRTTDVALAIQAAIAQINGEGDRNVHYLPLELAADMHLNHPTAAAYAPSGEKLIEKIKEITGWQ